MIPIKSTIMVGKRILKRLDSSNFFLIVIKHPHFVLDKNSNVLQQLLYQ